MGCGTGGFGARHGRARHGIRPWGFYVLSLICRFCFLSDFARRLRKGVSRQDEGRRSRKRREKCASVTGWGRGIYAAQGAQRAAKRARRPCKRPHIALQDMAFCTVNYGKTQCRKPQRWHQKTANRQLTAVLAVSFTIKTPLKLRQTASLPSGRSGVGYMKPHRNLPTAAPRTACLSRCGGIAQFDTLTTKAGWQVSSCQSRGVTCAAIFRGSRPTSSSLAGTEGYCPSR